MLEENIELVLNKTKGKGPSTSHRETYSLQKNPDIIAKNAELKQLHHKIVVQTH